VKDIDFDRNQVVVRRGKGQKDRRTMLPASVKARLTSHLAAVKRQHQLDLCEGLGRVVLPGARRIAARGASLYDSGYSEGTQRTIGGRAQRVVRSGWRGTSFRHCLSGRRQVTIQPLDVVVLTRDVSTHRLRRGDLGTVVEIYGPHSIGVEFVAASGRTQALVTLQPTDLRPVADDDLVAVRPSGSADRHDG